MYVGDRKCLRPPPRFKDDFFNLTWMATLTLLQTSDRLMPADSPGAFLYHSDVDVDSTIQFSYIFIAAYIIELSLRALQRSKPRV